MHMGEIMFISKSIRQRFSRIMQKFNTGTSDASGTREADSIYRRDSSQSLNQVKSLKGRFCPKPFTQFDIYEYGDAHCCCSSWITTPLGNVNKQPVKDIWNSEIAQDIRASIFDGSFKYCDHKLCPLIQNDTLPTLASAKVDPFLKPIIEEQKTILNTDPALINFCNDPSCNLSCPSCRIEKLILRTGPEFDARQEIQNKVVDGFISEPSDKAFTINVTGSGDPFASKIFRDFLFDLDGADFPNMLVNLQTNGVLFTKKNWEKLHKIHSNLQAMFISFDAATADTYAITRRGGNWDMLIENIQFLSERRQEGLFKLLRLDFVVQLDNYREMPAFVKLAKSLGADCASFSMVTDWGTWPKEVYETKCIWKETHPEFHEFLEVLKDPVFSESIVELGNLTEAYTQAQQKTQAA